MNQKRGASESESILFFGILLIQGDIQPKGIRHDPFFSRSEACAHSCPICCCAIRFLALIECPADPQCCSDDAVFLLEFPIFLPPFLIHTTFLLVLPESYQTRCPIIRTFSGKIKEILEMIPFPSLPQA